MSLVACPNCRFENPTDFFFCGHCGRNLFESPPHPRILVVDDEPRITELLQTLFELEGITIRTALSVQSALALMAEEEPDLIITDMMMPEVSGFDFIRMLKGNPKTRKIKIIVLSVLDTFEDVRKGVLLGADDYIPKPFDTDRLLLSVERLLGRFRKREAVS